MHVNRRRIKIRGRWGRELAVGVLLSHVEKRRIGRRVPDEVKYA